MANRKIYKVWSADRLVKKSVVVATFEELLTKGCSKLGYTGDVKVALEEDGTIVTDNDYFQLLDSSTTFMLLKDGEKWRDEMMAKSEDETDYPGRLDDSLQQIVQYLKSDISNLVILTKEQLQTVVDADPSTLSSMLGSHVEIDAMQRSCQRYLDEQLEIGEAMSAIKMLKSYVKEESEPPRKQAKLENSDATK